MKLLGWDTISALRVDLANQVFEVDHDRLMPEFKYKRDGFILEGAFGPWKIVPGGSMQLLHIDIPIRRGKAAGLTRVKRPRDLTGVTVRVEMPLRMVPSPDGTLPAKLMFDVPDDGPDAPVLVNPVGIVDKFKSLKPLEAELVQTLLCDCLSANMHKVSFVFAQVDAKAGGWLATPHLDWASIQLGDGRHYLAILGALRPPTAAMTPDKMDPELIAGPGAAYLAASPALFIERMLVPWLNTNFRPKAKFAAKGPSAQMVGQVRLPPVQSKLGPIHPVLSRLQFVLKGGALQVQTQTTVQIASARLEVTVALTMPFRFDAAQQQMVFAKDPKPKITKQVRGGGFTLVGFVVRLVLHWMDDHINALAQNIAQGMQRIHTAGQMPATWQGTRPFVPTEGKLEDCFWFGDTRPC